MIVSKNALLSFAEKNWRTIAIVILVLIAFFSIKSCSNSLHRIKQLEKVSEWRDGLHSSEIKKWKDENKELHEQVENLFTDALDLNFEVDSISDILSIKPKQIISFSKTGTTFSVNEKPVVDSVVKKVPIPQGDSDSMDIVTQYDFHWVAKDSSMKVWGTVGNGQDSVHVAGTDIISRTDYWKRKWFLGAKHYYSDFHHSNKYIETVWYQGAQISRKDKKWSLGVSVLYGYPVNYIQLKKPVTAVGVSLQYSFLRF
jgi:hypothetical protein